MTVLIAIPVFRIGCKVGIDRGRAWSVIDELVLWSITRQSKSVGALAEEANLPHQIIVASIARLMRFRLVEVAFTRGGVAFTASDYGFESVSSGDPLPFFPKRVSRRVSFVIEWATGDFFPTRQIRLMNQYKIDAARKDGAEVRTITVDEGGPSVSHEANLNRLADIATRGLDEQIALIDGRTATMRDNEFMVFRVTDGVPQGLPETAGPKLRQVVQETAALPPGTTRVPVTYAGPREDTDQEPRAHTGAFDPDDLVIGGSAQRTCLENLLAQAYRRVIIHSTFLDAVRFGELVEPIQEACSRGVTFDLLWGAEKDDDTERRNATAAIQIAKTISENPHMRGRFRVHMRTTGSHAKLMLVDTAEEGWLAVVGSCNWLSSPFQAVELSVILRNQHAVADVATALQRLTGRRGLADDIATELALTARDLRRMPSQDGDARLSVITGEAHDRLIRTASNSAKQKFVIGSNRLGSTARPGALMQGEVASRRDGVDAIVLYTQPSGPLKNRHARALAQEARTNGLALAKTKKIPLHGKFLAWDIDDFIVTSLNWASASTDADFPWGEIGVHIHAPGIASAALERLEKIFPELAASSSESST